MMKRPILALLVFCALGCGGVSFHEVTGSVTVDGQPLSEGYIAFVPTGPGTGGGGAIVDGIYKARAQRGANRVEITANKKMPLPPGQTGMNGAKEEVRQFIPARFNSKTDLTADVLGNGTFDFSIQSK